MLSRIFLSQQYKSSPLPLQHLRNQWKPPRPTISSDFLEFFHLTGRFFVILEIYYMLSLRSAFIFNLFLTIIKILNEFYSIFKSWLSELLWKFQISWKCWRNGKTVNWHFIVDTIFWYRNSAFNQRKAEKNFLISDIYNVIRHISNSILWHHFWLLWRWRRENEFEAFKKFSLNLNSSGILTHKIYCVRLF